MIYPLNVFLFGILIGCIYITLCSYWRWKVLRDDALNALKYAEHKMKIAIEMEKQARITKTFYKNLTDNHKNDHKITSR